MNIYFYYIQNYLITIYISKIVIIIFIIYIKGIKLLNQLYIISNNNDRNENKNAIEFYSTDHVWDAWKQLQYIQLYIQHHISDINEGRIDIMY